MSHPTNVTSEMTRKFWKEALAKWDGSVKDKNDSDFMKTVGWFLDKIGIQDKDTFLNSFTTTIGKTIYIPFEIGSSDNYTLWDQITVCVHELVHIQQYKDAPVEFSVGYVTDRSSRAEYEAQAYATGLELNYWRYGRLYNIPERMKTLFSYGLDQKHVDYAAEYLESIGETIVQGASVNEVAAWALTWLEKEGLQPVESV